MTLFLTSSPTGCPFEPGPEPAALDPRNHFIDRLRAAWPEEAPEGLLLAADPEAHAANDEACAYFAGCFARAGLPLDCLIPCDSRNQEEIGERGAFVTRDVVKPDIAICFEGCPADDTFTPDYFIQTAMKKGPMLRHFDKSMVTNPRFQRFSLELGRELGIPVQESVRSGGGTNGGPIHLSNGGVPVIIIGVPVRYIHSHHGFAAMVDYENSVKLAVEIIKRLNDETIKSF